MILSWALTGSVILAGPPTTGPLEGGAFQFTQGGKQDPLSIIRKLAKDGVKCPDYAEEVLKLVKAFPKQADEIIAEAVKLEPTCACETVKAGIIGMTPDGGVPDPRAVASVVALVVQYVQASNPELLETIVSCATDVAPDARPQILAAISSVLANPATTNNKTTILQGVSITASTPTPTPTPKPPVTPVPVTPVTPP